MHERWPLFGSAVESERPMDCSREGLRKSGELTVVAFSKLE